MYVFVLNLYKRMLCLQTCQVGLNFASEEETKRFRGHVTELVGRRQRKTGTNLLLLPPYLQTYLLTYLTEKNDTFSKYVSCAQNKPSFLSLFQVKVFQK